MKKIINILIILILIGCSVLKKDLNHTENIQDDLHLKTEEEMNVKNDKMSINEIENSSSEVSYHNEIMQGDLSSIEGEYINSEGYVIVIDAEDIKERLISEVTYTEDGYYFMNVLTDDGMYGIGLAIYPIGVEGLVWKVNSNEILSKTDTSKIRIRYYQAEAISETEYYYKK